MEIVLVRLDDRGVHGQVTVAWARRYRPDEIWVVNRFFASNPLLSKVQEATAPPGTRVLVLDADDAVRRFSEGRGARVMVLVADPGDALYLARGNVVFREMVLGQRGFAEGREKAFDTVYLSCEDARKLLELMDMGIDVYYQQLPSLPAVRHVRGVLAKIASSC